MNRRLLLVLLSAFVLAAGSSYIVFRLVGRRVTASRKSTTNVVAAASDIKLGTLLRSVDLTTIEIAGTPPKGVILNPKDAIGRGVIANLYQGEAILVPKETGNDLNTEACVFKRLGSTSP